MKCFFLIQIIIVMSNVDKILANSFSLDATIFWLLFHKLKFLRIFWKEYSKLNAEKIFWTNSKGISWNNSKIILHNNLEGIF